MEYTVKELADLAGVTPRTLRWYDREGLLHPARLTPAGYRLYGPEEVDRLQQVLFYRELGLGLSAIRSLLDDPAYDRQAALQSHLRELEARRARLDALRDEKGGTRMSDREKFECFKSRLLQEHETAYGAEVRARYGDQEADRAYARLSALTWEEYRSWEALGDRILAELAAAVRSGADPGSGWAFPGRSAPPRPTGAWPPSTPRTPASPPTTTGRSPAAPPSSGPRWRPISSELGAPPRALLSVSKKEKIRWMGNGGKV